MLSARPYQKSIPLALGDLGIVYGDIGTSPLYTIRECFHGTHAIELNGPNILGVLSLVFWSLTAVISFKYVVFILRADNRGEGGIFALTGLLRVESTSISARIRRVALSAGIVGAGLLYGDGIITPAISVLSAIEGLEVATSTAQPFVLPATCVILLLLFLFQRQGTSQIGKTFGPIMLLWFLSIGYLGLLQIIRNPEVIYAANPIRSIEFFARNRLHGMLVLGSVVLCITGGEALYADLGHFGTSPIRRSWFVLVCPALLLNYFGQGALLLKSPELAYNPFYGLVPKQLLYPMVGLSTIATIIASQALISGVFSMTHQAIQMGLCPRMRIVHTSGHIAGQIYIPAVNYFLMLACVGVSIGFGRSTGLAGAYGIAVTGTMAITSFLFFLVITHRWGWPLWGALPLIAIFFIFDLSFLGGNLLKVMDGGWFTLIAASLIFVIMSTWRRGREELGLRMNKERVPISVLLEDIEDHGVPRVPGTAVFMSISSSGAPITLLHQLKHNHVLHEKVILLTIQSLDIPVVAAGERVRIDDLGLGFYRVVTLNGFMQKPSVPEILELAQRSGLVLDSASTSYYLGRETLVTTGKSKMARWRKALFAFLSRNAATPAAFFDVPSNRVVELGTQIEL
ncbi:MAG: potassium transporter Kup [Deltaproteobacteria bacterium HGW-Deltaproteobacteria-21]|nr:MAG: potassium transporter Kup [Deltaproteobacteria bacterium HGW-Deltaproteobacteria-21]